MKITTTSEGEGPAVHEGLLGRRPGDPDPELRPARLRELRQDDHQGRQQRPTSGADRPKPQSAPDGLGGGVPRAPSGRRATTPGISGGAVRAAAAGSTAPGQSPGPLGGPPAWSASGTPSTSNSSSSSPAWSARTRGTAWAAPGKIEYFDIGTALVVNQTADVIQEVRGPAGGTAAAAGPGGRGRGPDRLAVRVVVRADGRGLLDEHQDPHHAVRAGLTQVDPNTGCRRVPPDAVHQRHQQQGRDRRPDPGRQLHPGPGRADPADQLRAGRPAVRRLPEHARRRTAASRSGWRSSTTSRCTCSWRPPRATAG